jgi:hypothetical protein
MQKNNSKFDIVAIGYNNSKPKVFYQTISESGSSFKIGTAFSGCEKVLLDIKTISAPHAYFGDKITNESKKYSLDEFNPFDIKIDRRRTSLSDRYIKSLISYNKKNNIVEINTEKIFSKGFFSFSISLNFSSEGFTRGKSTKEQSVFSIVPNDQAGRFFDGVSVRVVNNNLQPPAIVIDEFNRFSQDRLFTFKKSDSFGCSRINVDYSASGNYQFIESGFLSNLIIENNVELTLLPGFPFINLSDRIYSPTLRSKINYENNNPKLQTNIYHTQYINRDGVAFFDQVVKRSLVGSNGGQSNHPLVAIKDIFSSLNTKDSVPVLNFRREYNKRESYENGKIPYHLYMTPSSVSASESYVECIGLRVDRSIASDITFEYKIIHRSKYRFRIESKTIFESNGTKSMFYGSLDLNSSPNGLNGRMPFGNFKVFHEDDNVDYVDRSSFGLTVLDIFNALSRNVGGVVSPSSPSGTGSQTHSGFVPTFAELGIDSEFSQLPIVSFEKLKDFNGCELISSSRLYSGNDSLGNEISSYSFSGIKSKGILYCRGLKNDVNLESYLAIAPINRCLTTAFVRGDIKNFEDHASSFDFLSIEDGGNGYSRFYKYDTIESSINIMKYGSSYFDGMLNISDIEKSMMVAPGPASFTRSYGEYRELFGASQVGIKIDFLSSEPESEFFKNTPSYVMSHLCLSYLDFSENKNLSKVSEIIPSSGDGIFICYKNTDMFPGPYGYRGGDYVPRPSVAKVDFFGENENGSVGGGIFHCLYTTSGVGSHIKGIKDIKDADSVKYSLSLNPLQFDNNALLVYEGGDNLIEKRFIEINNCNKWINNSTFKDRIISAFIRNEMIESAISNGWTIGKMIETKFYTSDQSSNVGRLIICGSGKRLISSYLNYDFDSKSVTFANTLGVNKVITHSASDFKAYHDATFDGLLELEMSPHFSPNENIPYSELIFNRVYNKNDFDTIIENYDEYNPYAYSSTYFYEEPNSELGYTYEDSYDPYFGFLEKDFYNIYKNETLRSSESGLNFYIDYLKSNKYPRSYSFYLNNNKYKSVLDLMDDINSTIGQYGIQAVPNVDNPEFYHPSKIISKQESDIVSAKYNFTKIVNQPPLPYDYYYSVDDYSSIPYQINNNEYFNAPSLPITQPYFNEDSYQLISDEYNESNSYSINYQFNLGERDDIATPSVSYEKVRSYSLNDYKINISYDVYDDQNLDVQKLTFDFSSKTGSFFPVFSINFSEKRPRYSIGLVDMQYNFVANNGEPNSSEIYDSTFNESFAIEYRDQTSGGSEDFVVSFSSVAYSTLAINALEISYGGQQSGGSINLNYAPNTYFSNTEQSGIGQLEFRTVDADYAFLLIRIKYSNDSYGPIFNGTSSDIYSSLKAKVYYSSTVDPEVVYGEPANNLCIEKVEETDENEEYFYLPIQIKIPLKSTINFVNIEYSSASASARIIDAPSSLLNFGFLAINNNNPNYNMRESRNVSSFGLVLDNFGNYDILISPEASLSSVEFGNFSFNGRGYSRTVIDSDDTYIAGIGNPVIDPDDGDITGFDNSMIPSEYVSSISVIPVPGYPQVWALRISPSLRSILVAKRRSSAPGSLENCYIDIPIYFQANTTGSFGTCNVRVFADVRCVFNYNFCDFFWNLGTPLVPPPAYSIESDMSIDFEELIDCEESAILINDGGIQKVQITNYFIFNIRNIPMLDNGTSLLLIKSDLTQGKIRQIFAPSQSKLSSLKRKDGNGERPWLFTCSTFTASEFAKMNKMIMYTDPQDSTRYETDQVQIASSINLLPKFMLVQPKFGFPAYDETGISSPNEVIVASIGFNFNDWKPNLENQWNVLRIFVGLRFVVLPDEGQINLLQNFSIKYLYSEDRRLR